MYNNHVGLPNEPSQGYRQENREQFMTWECCVSDVVVSGMRGANVPKLSPDKEFQKYEHLRTN